MPRREAEAGESLEPIGIGTYERERDREMLRVTSSQFPPNEVKNSMKKNIFLGVTNYIGKDFH